jgi:hypothetical protein
MYGKILIKLDSFEAQGNMIWGYNAKEKDLFQIITFQLWHPTVCLDFLACQLVFHHHNLNYLPQNNEKGEII